MVFHIVILQVYVQCVNCYITTMKDFEYVILLIENGFTSKSNNDVTYVACPKSPVTHTFYSEHIAGTIQSYS